MDQNDRTITINCSDNFGCDIPDDDESKSYTSGTVKTDTVQLNDIAGNKADCNYNVYVDKEAPECKSATGATTEWKKSKTITPGCEDVHDGSDCKSIDAITYNATNNPDQEITTDKATISDNVGNTRDCTFNVCVDNKAPTIPTVNMLKFINNSDAPSDTTRSSKTNETYTSGWSNKKVHTYPSGSTDGGVSSSGNITYQYTTTGKTSNATDSEAKYRNIRAQGTSTVKWRACDALDNCSDYSAENTIKVDTEAPKYSVILKKDSASGDNYSTGSWTSTNVYTGVVLDDEEDSSTYDISPIASYSYELTRTAGASGGPWSGTTSERLIKSSGTYTIEYTVTDEAGNPKTIDKKNIMIDKEPITINLSAKDSDGNNYTFGNWTNKSITVTAEANKSDATFAYTLTRDVGTAGGPWNGNTSSRTIDTEGEYTITYTATDPTNNTSATVSKKIRIDKTPPQGYTIDVNATNNLNICTGVSGSKSGDTWKYTGKKCASGAIVYATTCDDNIGDVVSGIDKKYIKWELTTGSYDNNSDYKRFTNYEYQCSFLFFGCSYKKITGKWIEKPTYENNVGSSYQYTFNGISPATGSVIRYGRYCTDIAGNSSTKMIFDITSLQAPGGC